MYKGNGYGIVKRTVKARTESLKLLITKLK